MVDGRHKDKEKGEFCSFSVSLSCLASSHLSLDEYQILNFLFASRLARTGQRTRDNIFVTIGRSWMTQWVSTGASDVLGGSHIVASTVSTVIYTISSLSTDILIALPRLLLPPWVSSWKSTSPQYVLVSDHLHEIPCSSRTLFYCHDNSLFLRYSGSLYALTMHSSSVAPMAWSRWHDFLPLVLVPLVLLYAGYQPTIVGSCDEA